MIRRVVLTVLDLLGVLATIAASLSGLGAYLFGGSRAAFEEPTIIWFAPLFLTPLAVAGIAMIATSSLIAKKRRKLVGWSALAVFVMLAMTMAVFNLTGLSTGEIELTESVWGTVAVATSLVYAASVLASSVVGIIVARDILREPDGPVGLPTVQA